MPPNSRLLKKKRLDKERNLIWQQRKRWHLDKNGIVVMDNGETPRELDSVEREWNQEMMQMETAKLAASAGTDTIGDAASDAPSTGTEGWAAAASAGPAVEMKDKPLVAASSGSGATSGTGPTGDQRLSSGQTSPRRRRLNP